MDVEEDEFVRAYLARNIIGSFSGIMVMIILSIFIPGWWWYMIIGFILIGTIANIMRYYAIERIHCPKCNQPAHKNDKFCKYCGLKFVNRCPKCNKPLTIGSKFCENCGTPLEEPKPIEKPVEFPVQKPQEIAATVNFCPGCGERIENPNAKHCSLCGTSLK